jgi:hypothetical protein
VFEDDDKIVRAIRGMVQVAVRKFRERAQGRKAGANSPPFNEAIFSARSATAMKQIAQIGGGWHQCSGISGFGAKQSVNAGRKVQRAAG